MHVLAGALPPVSTGGAYSAPAPSWIEEAYLRKKEPLLMGWKRKGKEDFNSI